MVKYVHISSIESVNKVMTELNKRKRNVCLDEIPEMFKKGASLFLIGKTVIVEGDKDYMNYLDFHEFYLQLNGAAQ